MSGQRAFGGRIEGGAWLDAEPGETPPALFDGLEALGSESLAYRRAKVWVDDQDLPVPFASRCLTLSVGKLTQQMVSVGPEDGATEDASVVAKNPHLLMGGVGERGEGAKSYVYVHRARNPPPQTIS